MSDRPKSVATAPLHLGGLTVEVHVLSSGERVLTARSVVKALTSRLREDGGSDSAANPSDLGRYMARAPARIADMALPPVSFETKNGLTAHGYTAEFFTDLVHAYVEAQINGELRKDQAHLGRQAWQLSKALAGVGLIALIDEVTGYQAHRELDDLQRRMDAFLRRDAADWQKFWTPDIVASLCKTFRIRYDGVHYPAVLNGHIGTIYGVVLGREVHGELKRRNPRRSGRAMHHQFFQDELRAFSSHNLHLIKNISDCSANKREFFDRLRRAFRGDAIQLDLGASDA